MMNLGKWAEFRHLFAPSRNKLGALIPAYAQISGGRTSAIMAALCPDDVTLLFQNTSREREETLVFLQRLQEALKRPITWLEWRPPKTLGAPPKDFLFEVVTYETACRDGSLFWEMLKALADFRRLTKDEPPVAPWARMRLCTSYLKHKVKDHYVQQQLGVREYETFLGLRADEPSRLDKMEELTTRLQTFRAPLADMGMVKNDIWGFWRDQSFDLELADHEGNCGACFLKDEADLARLMNDPRNDPEWWIAARDKWPDFGGRRFIGYRELRAEYTQRCRIEEALGVGGVPINLGKMDDRRFRNVVRQERERMFGERKHVSCACEGTQMDLDMFV